MAQSGSFILIAAFICIPGLYSAAVWAIDVARCPDGGCDADVADETSLLQGLHRLDGTTTITTAFALPSPPRIFMLISTFRTVSRAYLR